MTKNANSTRKVEMPNGIKSKFAAALCMLLVSAIMLISSTYAWFTLSTAPEVRGITTNVGANGNLEIVLLDEDSYASTADDLGILSELGDSTTVIGAVESNKKWGNLIDLSDASYGLNNMVLTPARLNYNGTFVDPSILLAPSYGSDGRVIDVTTPTYTANFKDGGFTYDAAAAGVRGIGTTSGATKRVAAYRTALSTAASAMASALAQADNSLSANAQSIATLMVAYVQNPNANFDASYLDTFQNIINGIKTSNDNAMTAIRQTALAYTLSKAHAGELTDDEVTALVTGAETSLDGLDMPAGLSDAVDVQEATAQALTNAQADLDALKATPAQSYTWAQISPIFNVLVNKDNVTICGLSLASSTKDEIINAAANSAMAGNGVPLEFLENSGVYYNISAMCGYYQVTTTVNITYNGVDLKPPATITVNAVDPYIPAAIAVVRTAGAPEISLGEGTQVTLSDTYGYALDFGFRTNAASSNLLLQTSAAQRVYTDSTSARTQGMGSNMQFTSSNTKIFSQEDVHALMSAIRVAFVSANDNGYDLLALGALDITATTDPGTGVTTYTGGEAIDDNGYKADLSLYNYTRGDDGVITLGDKADTSVITNLDQNKAKKITAVVYLDGDLVDNTMVANANQSMTGLLNLQFSSSANLVPMENSALRNYPNA